MIIRPQLQNFADNIGKQQQALADVSVSMQKWKESEIGQKQRHVILKAGDTKTPQSCADTLCALFQDISWVYDIMRTFCRIQQTNPFANIELRTRKSERIENIILHQEAKFSINLSLMKSCDPENSSRSNDRFIFGPDIKIMSIMGKTGHLKRATLDAEKNILFDPNAIPTDDSKVFIYDNRQESYNIITAKKDIIFLQAIVKRNAFDIAPDDKFHHYLSYTDGQKPLYSNADQTISRAQFMISILRTQNCKKAIPIFKYWLRSDSPDMRWYVMREFIAIDAASAIPDLICMAQYDDNREIRRTAFQTWGILKNRHPELFPEDKH